MPKRNDKEAEKTHWRRQAREVADSLAIAFILAMVIRHFVLEVFKIPTKSMQPTLLGHPYTGDKILVNKFAYDFRDPRRWEVIVFKYPVDPSKNYIKRLIGLPNETIRIYGGDVYVRTAEGNPHWAIARKPWNVQQALWRRRLTRGEEGESFWVPGNRDAWEPRGGDFAVEANGAATQYLVFEREVLAYEAREFNESQRGFTRILTGDVMVQFRLVLDGPAEIDVDVDVLAALGPGELSDGWTVRFVRDDRGASVQLRRADTEVQRAELGTASLRDGKPALVQVCNVDEAILVRVGGREVINHPYKPLKRMTDVFQPSQRQARVRLGCRGGRAVFRDPAVYVDVYYTNSPDRHAVLEPFTLGPDEFFVLGDNSANSNDSRQWGVVHRDKLVGEAFLLLWPLGRMKLVR